MDDVNFLKSHGTEVDHEVLVDSSLALTGNTSTYHFQLPTPLQNVIDIRMKLCYVPSPVYNITQTCQLVYNAQSTIPVGVGAYTPTQLAETLANIVTYNEVTRRFVALSDVFFRKFTNNTALCRLLGLPPHSDVYVNANEEFPLIADFATAQVAQIHISDYVTMIVPTDVVHKEDQNTRRPYFHPVTVIKGVDVKILDRDGQFLNSTNNWFVVQFRVLSLTNSSIPLDFQPTIAAHGYQPCRGLYANNDDSDSDIYPDSEDNGICYDV